MSFLDNLENNLKALENRDERDPEKVKRDQELREAERAFALSRAPFVEALKKAPFISDLLTECRAIGRGQRVLVQFVWIEDNLRLDAQARRMELVATPDGICAVLSHNSIEVERIPIDMACDNAGALARRWLE